MFIDSRLLDKTSGNKALDCGTPSIYMNLRARQILLSPAASDKYKMCHPVQINTDTRELRIAYIPKNSRSSDKLKKSRMSIGCGSINDALGIPEMRGTLVLKIDKITCGFLYVKIPEESEFHLYMK